MGKDLAISGLGLRFGTRTHADGKELININSNIPYFPGISESVLGFAEISPGLWCDSVADAAENP